MAKIAKRSNHLKGDLYIKYSTIALLVGVSLCSIVSIFMITPFSIIGVVISIFLIKIITNKINIIKFGLQGEKEVLQTLKKLPKGYTVLSDVSIVDKNKSSQIDFVVIGINGIFIIESKHVKGTIKGNVNDKYLSKVKVTGGGKNTYIKQMYNPILQILGHKKGITKLLKKHNYSYAVSPMVYFSNDAKVNLKSSKVKIFIKENELLKYIKNYKNNKNIEYRDQKKIIKILKKC
jgi:hypothetical protein